MKLRYVTPNSNLDLGLSRSYSRLALAYARKTRLACEKDNLGDASRFSKRFAEMAIASGAFGLLGKQRSGSSQSRLV